MWCRALKVIMWIVAPTMRENASTSLVLRPAAVIRHNLRAILTSEVAWFFMEEGRKNGRRQPAGEIAKQNDAIQVMFGMATGVPIAVDFSAAGFDTAHFGLKWLRPGEVTGLLNVDDSRAVSGTVRFRE